MPTFIFYRNKAKIDRLQGANVEVLESKIQQHVGSGDEDSGEDFGQGLVCSSDDSGKSTVKSR